MCWLDSLGLVPFKFCSISVINISCRVFLDATFLCYNQPPHRQNCLHSPYQFARPLCDQNEGFDKCVFFSLDIHDYIPKSIRDITYSGGSFNWSSISASCCLSSPRISHSQTEGKAILWFVIFPLFQLPANVESRSIKAGWKRWSLE